MTKLMEWLIGGFTLTGVWLAILFGYDSSSLDIKLQYAILWLPVIGLFTFGLYALIVILYRVFTFNDCEEAATELKMQIEEAVTDLTSKGIKLKTKQK